MNKAKVVALVALLVGVLCHVGGVTYSADDELQVLHGVGLVFDAVAGISAMVGRKGRAGTGGGGAVLLVLLGVMLTTAGGCFSATGGGGAVTDEQKLQAAQRTMTSIENGILLAQATGKISGEQAKTLLDAGDAAHAAYQSLLEAYTKGQPLDVGAVHDAFNKAVRSYIDQLTKSGVEVKDDGTGGTSPGAARRQPDGRAVGAGAPAAHAVRDPSDAATARALARGQPRDRRAA